MALKQKLTDIKAEHDRLQPWKEEEGCLQEEKTQSLEQPLGDLRMGGDRLMVQVPKQVAEMHRKLDTT
jgi:hypothetical protein